MRAPTESTRIEMIEGADAAQAIRAFAEAVRRAPGVWAATVRECRLRGGAFDLHLIVHGEVEDDVEPFAPQGWWIR